MKVTVKLAPPYSDLSGQRIIELELPESATVGLLLSEIERLYPQIASLLVDDSGEPGLGTNFFVTVGAHIGNMSDILAPGESVRLFPAIGGGQYSEPSRKNCRDGSN